MLLGQKQKKVTKLTTVHQFYSYTKLISQTQKIYIINPSRFTRNCDL